MEIVLKDGSVLKCDTAEALRLKNLGFFGTIDVMKEKKVNKITDILKKMKKNKNIEVNFEVEDEEEVPVRSYNSSKRKKFSKKEDRVIKEVWKQRKNHIRLTDKEYRTIMKMLPGRDRKMISRRLHRLKKYGKMK
jgi:RNase adaptor protein for sRNA GlmZ degradation